MQNTNVVQVLIAKCGSAYRVRFSHIYGRTDSCRFAFSSSVHFFYNTMHVASWEAMEKHSCRRGYDVVGVFFRSATQDFLKTQTKPVHLQSGYSPLGATSKNSRSEKIRGKNGHVFATLYHLPMEIIIRISAALIITKI